VKDHPLFGRGASIVEVEKARIKQFTDYYDTLSFFPSLRRKKSRDLSQ